MTEDDRETLQWLLGRMTDEAILGRAGGHGMLDFQRLTDARSLIERMIEAPDDDLRTGCPVHSGMVHGGEAEELRDGIEKLIDNASPHGMVHRSDLQALIDRVDARDSLAHLERQDVLERLVTIADEAFGLGPVEPVADTLSRIERGIFEQHRRLVNLESAIRSLLASDLPAEQLRAELGRLVL